MAGLLGVLSFIALSLNAQENIHCEETKNVDVTATELGDTSQKVTNILEAFRRGHFHGHIRNYFMATVNDGPLRDYWTNASGGALRFETERLYGFTAGVKGIFSFRTFSDDLNTVDTLTGKSGKWEKELYDYLRPEESTDLDRLEELFIAWRYKNSFIKYGKQDINTGPLLLRRDGRMKPFVYRGLWTEINHLENQHYYAGWIDKVSPRGLTEWFSINEAIGINNNGIEPDGSKAHYHESAESKGIAVLGMKNKLKKHHTIQFWNYWFHNMFNTTWIQADITHNDLYGGVQYVYQQALTRQESLLYEERYMQPDEQANVISANFGTKKNGFDVSASYLHAFDTGRFLYPREMGRENFYVSQPRSWIDGFGDLDVYMLRFKFNPDNDHSTWYDLRLTYTDTPGAENTEFNKYGMEDFYAVTFLLDHEFHGLLEGLDIAVLYVGRFDTKENPIALENKAYKYDMHHFNVIANIKF